MLSLTGQAGRSGICPVRRSARSVSYRIRRRFSFVSHIFKRAGEGNVRCRSPVAQAFALCDVRLQLTFPQFRLRLASDVSQHPRASRLIALADRNRRFSLFLLSAPSYSGSLLSPSNHKKNRLKAVSFMERVKGIEPSYSAWEAAALPLSYTRESVTLSFYKFVKTLCR